MTRLVSVVVDAVDHVGLARWWGRALRVPVSGEEPDEAWLDLERPDGPRLQLVFLPVAEPKVATNRIHLDLATYSMVEYVERVERLIARGARHVDVGPTGGGGVVLADPEGNELGLLEPRPAKGYDGPLAVVVVHTAALDATVDFWIEAAGWDVVSRDAGGAELRDPSGRGPYLSFVPVDEPKVAKLRIHLDVAPGPEDDHTVAVDRLIAAGAERVDIGQGDVGWVVLADPGGNELCVLTPR